MTVVLFQIFYTKIRVEDFVAELQSIESWEDVPLEFHWLSTDSITISVDLRSCDPSCPVLPRFGLRMLMDPSKTQHRIRKDVDSFTINQ